MASVALPLTTVAVLDTPVSLAGAVVPAALARGLVVNRTAGSVIRLLPPYVITEAEIAEGLALLEAALSDVLRADAPGGAHG